MPDVAAEARRMHYGGETIRAQLRRQIARVIDPFHIARLLFIGPDGQVKPEAVEWLTRLARENWVNDPMFHEEPLEMARRDGRRALVLEIMRSLRLDVAKLEQLSRQEREAE